MTNSGRSRRRWGRRPGIVLVSLLVLNSCGTARIDLDAERWRMQGRPCNEAGCLPVPPTCSGGRSSGAEDRACQVWLTVGADNKEALQHKREASTWVRDESWPEWLRWLPSEKKTTEWSPAIDSGAAERRRPANETPQLWLAMSGGGLRAAAVHIGVLSGLSALSVNRPGGGATPGSSVLERIDAVSAVSGGSSALAWYFTQHWYGLEAPRKPSREDVDQRLFADELQPQQYLRNHFTTFSKVEYGLGAAANGLLAPVNLFLNGLFGWHANTSPMRAWYEARLRTTFQADPTDPEGRT